MKPFRFILPALLLLVFLGCWLMAISLQRSRVRIVNAPNVSDTSVQVQGILSDSNFQAVLHAVKQSNGAKPLREPAVTTINHLAVNQWNQTLTLPVTNK